MTETANITLVEASAQVAEAIVNIAKTTPEGGREIPFVFSNNAIMAFVRNGSTLTIVYREVRGPSYDKPAILPFTGRGLEALAREVTAALAERSKRVEEGFQFTTPPPLPKAQREGAILARLRECSEPHRPVSSGLPSEFGNTVEPEDEENYNSEPMILDPKRHTPEED